MFLIRSGDSGSYVEMVQLALRRAGFSPGVLDGQFGSQTLSAVRGFQRANGLVADGIVGNQTFARLRPFLVGYARHTVAAGDTVAALAAQYGTTTERINNANPDLVDTNLQIGSVLAIPLAVAPVPTEISYNALLTELVVEGLAVRYPFVGLSVVGRSVLNRPLPLLTIGKGAKKVFFNASHHANEWITTPMVLQFLAEYAEAVVNATEIGGQNAEMLFNQTTLSIMPLVNPDGVDLITGALSKESEAYLDILVMANRYPWIPFPSGWKANANGVDLNLNYPAMWEEARAQKFAAGFTRPGPRDFVGMAPLDQPESRAVYDLSIAEDFDLTVSLHTQGEEIYWRFGTYQPPRGEAIGQQMAEVSGYILTDPEDFSSFAGYKDWFVMNYLRPGYTIEAGRGINPLPISGFAAFYPPVRAILTVALTEV